MAILSFVSCVGCFIWVANSPQGGVLTANELEPYARTLIDDRRLLRDGERLLVFYDASISLDGSEVAIVTNRAVSHLKSDNLTRYELDEVEDIEVRDGDLSTDFVIVHESGERLRFDVSAFNGEKLFADTLMDAWAKAYETDKR